MSDDRPVPSAGPAAAPDPSAAPVGPASARTTVRRGAHRAVYERAAITEIIDASPLCHVGVSTPDGPMVLPMAPGRDDEWLYLHGAAANGVLNAAVGTEVCVTFTLLDGLVLARTAFHNSVNYRSVVVRGVARSVDGPDKVRALRLISDHVVPTWDAGRGPTGAEVRRTLVVAVPLAEASAKVRSGDPVDEPEDLGGPWWAGTVPLGQRWGAPVPAADLPAGIPVPDAVRGLTSL